MTAEAQLVVDASVAVKWYVPEVLSDQARQLLRDPTLLIAPNVLPAEFGHVIRKKHKNGEILAGSARLAIANVVELIQLRAMDVSLLDAAWDITVCYDRSFYDALYVALAVQEGCRLVTADERLVGALTPALRDSLLLLSDR